MKVQTEAQNSFVEYTVCKSSCKFLAMITENKLKQDLLLDAVLEEASLGADEDHFSCKTLQLMQSCESISHSLFTASTAIIASCIYHIPAPASRRRLHEGFNVACLQVYLKPRFTVLAELKTYCLLIFSVCYCM